MVLAQPQSAAPDACEISVSRSGPDVWWLTFGDQCAARVLTSLPSASRARPSQVLQQCAPASVGPCVLAKVELDVCGAWLTVSNVGPARPVLVRRAGWVELRGHPEATGAGDAFFDDRIGLGPGDVLLFPSAVGGEAQDDSVTDALFDVALRSAGCGREELIVLVSGRAGYAAAIGVPSELGPDPLARVAEAIGVPASEVQSPGYPLGDLQPDLWKTPPPPPRAARLRLTEDRSSVRTVRSLLDRLLSSWRLDGWVDEDDLKLVATELSTNAVVHAGSPETITIRYLGDKIRVEVDDRSPAIPRPREANLHAEGGRGMRLVESLSESWGVDPSGNGKRVWCEVSVAPSH